MQIFVPSWQASDFRRVLKSIEFGAEKIAAESAEPKTLEMMLLEKNKTLQTENTALKVARQELEGERMFVANACACTANEGLQ